MHEEFETIWRRICDNAEKQFCTKQGKTFKYKIENDCFIPLRPKGAPNNITKSLIEKAYNQWPITGPGDFSGNILAPSYLWGVFNDDRIIKKEE